MIEMIEYEWYVPPKRMVMLRLARAATCFINLMRFVIVARCSDDDIDGKNSCRSQSLPVAASKMPPVTDSAMRPGLDPRCINQFLSTFGQGYTSTLDAHICHVSLFC